MPVVTLRIVASASASNCAPLLPKKWIASFRERLAPWPELARRNPATTIAKNCNTPMPTSADAASRPAAAPLSSGARLCRAAAKLVEARLQSSLKRLPMMGQVAMLAGGAESSGPRLAIGHVRLSFADHDRLTYAP